MKKYGKTSQTGQGEEKHPPTPLTDGVSLGLWSLVFGQCPKIWSWVGMTSPPQPASFLSKLAGCRGVELP